MPVADNYTEQELIALLRSGSQDAYTYLYQNYAGALYGVIRLVVTDEQTAQDVLQDSFVKIWNNLEKFDEGKGRLYTWMLNVARNTAIDKLRSRGEIMKGKIHPGEDIVSTISEGLKTEQVTDAIGLKEIVANLKPDHYNIIQLAYYKGYTLDEVSKELNVPLGTVKTRMRSAMQQLRTTFKR